METIYPNISLKELREFIKVNKNFKLVKVSSYDGWRYAIYDKKYNYKAHVEKNGGEIKATY